MAGPPSAQPSEDRAEMQSWIDRSRAAFGRLARLGPADEILKAAAEEAAQLLQLRRVFVSRVLDGALVLAGLWVDDEDQRVELAAALDRPVPVAYPVVEAEILRLRRPVLVQLSEKDAAVRSAHAAALEWRTYIVAPVVIGAKVVGLVHADGKADRTPLTQLDADQLGAFADTFGLLFERAVLRQRLRHQQRAMRDMARWAEGRVSDLSDAAVNLVIDAASAPEGLGSPLQDDNGFAELLTKREVDVLKLMAQGDTNAAIAQALVLSEGTIKFHVKNILRKLHAANRAEATSRYLQLTWKRSQQGAG